MTMRYDYDRTLPESRLLAVLRIALGGLFIVTGAAKAADLPPFLHAVGTIAGAAPAGAAVLGTLIVLAEIAGGTALVLRYRVPFVAFLLGGLTATFAGIMLDALGNGMPIDCHCFGLFGSLPTQAEFIVDLVLLDALLILSTLSRQKRMPPLGVIGSLCALVVLFALEVNSVHVALGSTAEAMAHDFQLPLAVLEDHAPEFKSSRTGSRVLLLLRYADFSCPLCFEDFMLLSDSLGAEPPAVRRRVAGLICMDSSALFRTPERLARWVHRSGINYPVVPAPEDLFAATGIRKSTLAVVDPAGHTLFTGEFPLGQEQRTRVLRLVEQEGRE